MTLYKSTVDVETFNMTLGLKIQPGDIIDIDYNNKTVVNQTSGVKSKIRDLEATFDGIKDESGKYKNTLKERMESGNDGNFIPYNESKTKSTKKGGS